MREELEDLKRDLERRQRQLAKELARRSQQSFAADEALAKATKTMKVKTATSQAAAMLDGQTRATYAEVSRQLAAVNAKLKES